MDYQVPCDCGKSVAVNAGAAGSRVTCGCGRAVDVPSFRELRRLNGEDFNVNPVIEIRELLAAGRLPPPSCVRCGRDNAEAVTIVAECERRWVRREGRWRWLTFFFILPFGLFYALAHAAMPSTAEVLNAGLTLRLPLRICPTCRSGLSGRRELRDVLREVPAYARLLDRYPKAKLKASVEPSGRRG